MWYSEYEERIVQAHSILLQGWTYPNLINPGQLSTSLPALRGLRDAIKDGTCKFVTLTQDELKIRRENILQEIQAGSRPPTKARAQRSDLGSKRMRSDENDEGTAPKQKKTKCAPAQHPSLHKSASVIESSSDEE